MIGGAISPGKKWLNSLPVIDWDNLGSQIGIFKGTIETEAGVYRNPVVYILPDGNEFKLYIVIATGSWVFDEENNNFVEQPGTELATEIIEAAGISSFVNYGGRHTEAYVTKEMVGWVLLPA